MRAACLFLPLLVFLCLPVVAADEPEALPLPDPLPRTWRVTELEALALRHHPALHAARARVQAARGGQVQAGLYPNPVIGYHGMEMGDGDTAGQQGAFVEQTFVTGGKRRLDEAIAGAAVGVRQAGYRAVQQRVLTDVRVRFYQAMIAQRRLELTDELERISRDLVKSTQQLVAARQRSENDLLQAEIEAEQVATLLDQAQRTHVEAWRRLAAVVGVPELEMTRLPGRPDGALPGIRWEDAWATVLGDHPQLAAARARIEQARCTLARARREVIPDVTLLVSVRHINPSGDDSASVAAGLPIPAFDRNQGAIMRARAELAAARSDYQRVQLDLYDRLAEVFQRYETARQQAERYAERILPRASRSLELVTTGYREGQVDYLTVITSQRTFIQASLTHLDAVGQLRQAAAEIEGQLLIGSLAGN